MPDSEFDPSPGETGFIVPESVCSERVDVAEQVLNR